jgi:hypothetical protein
MSEREEADRVGDGLGEVIANAKSRLFHFFRQ